MQRLSYCKERASASVRKKYAFNSYLYNGSNLCLFFPIITHEPLYPIASNFDLGTKQKHAGMFKMSGTTFIKKVKFLGKVWFPSHDTSVSRDQNSHQWQCCIIDMCLRLFLYHLNIIQISPKIHPDITHISSRYHPHIIQITHISSRYHPNIIQISPTYHPDITQISPKYHPKFIQISPKYHPDITNI